MMNDEYWLEYVKHCYELVLESEGNAQLILEHDVEAYVVHLMARNFNRVDIGSNPIAIQMLTALSGLGKEKFIAAADECLLIHSFPLKQTKWPSKNYYLEMGTIAYGMAGHMMEKHVEPAARVMSGIFNRKFNLFNHAVNIRF
jgi:hypothetical protein